MRSAQGLYVWVVHPVHGVVLSRPQLYTGARRSQLAGHVLPPMKDPSANASVATLQKVASTHTLFERCHFCPFPRYLLHSHRQYVRTSQEAGGTISYAGYCRINEHSPGRKGH